MNVLVTGATGFTGGHLARGLAARGHQVSALVRETGPAAAGLAKAGVTLVVGDLRDPAALASATSDVEVVYHIAAIYRQAGLSNDTYRAVNATAVQHIIEAAARHGIEVPRLCYKPGLRPDGNCRASRLT